MGLTAENKRDIKRQKKHLIQQGKRSIQSFAAVRTPSPAFRQGYEQIDWRK
jgi:hypothetical protein